VIQAGGAINFRDLIAFSALGLFRGSVFRTGTLAGLDRESARQLVGQTSLRGFVDLRTVQERERDGEATRLAEAGVVVHHHPIDEGRTRVRAHRDPSPEDYAQSYVAMLDLAAAALGTVLDLIALGQLPLAFGCTAGKDRTGVVAALLLACLGAEEDAIVEDYAATTSALAGHLGAFEAHWTRKGLSPQAYAARLVAHPQAMRTFLGAVRASASTIPAALAARGISPARIERASQRLRVNRLVP
jgi:protein-tyrosine phosphatase